MDSALQMLALSMIVMGGILLWGAPIAKNLLLPMLSSTAKNMPSNATGGLDLEKTAEHMLGYMGKEHILTSRFSVILAASPYFAGHVGIAFLVLGLFLLAVSIIGVIGGLGDNRILLIIVSSMCGNTLGKGLSPDARLTFPAHNMCCPLSPGFVGCKLLDISPA